MRLRDTWFAQITPFDEVENGVTTDVPSVTVQKLPPAANQLEILPRNPTDQDILQASYSVNDPNTGTILLEDKSKITWFVNGIERVEAANSKFVRFGLVPGDNVWFSIVPSDGIFDGESLVSEPVNIIDGDFRILNLRVDGLSENISIKSVNPTLDWDVLEPFGRTARYARIQIGTAPGSNSVFQTITETFEEKFIVPDHVIERGVDYYATVTASDSPDVFKHPVTSHFRVAGSLWEREVSNVTGWTIEVAVRIEGDIGFQKLSIGDGTYFADIRFYADKVDLLLGKSNIKTYSLDMTVTRNLIVIGKANNIKIYEKNELILDGTNEFTQPDSERFIEVGASADSETIGYFKRLVYTTNGSYDPKEDSSIYSDIHLEQFIDFVGTSVSDIIEHEGDVLVSTNPRNDDDSGKIYKIVETEQPVLAATENIDEFALKINDISGCPDDKFTYISHTKGASYFENFFLASFDSKVDFGPGVDPRNHGWEQIGTSPFTAATFTKSGLVIDTTFANTARIDTRVLLTNQNIDALLLEWKFDFILGNFDYDVQITASIITIRSNINNAEVYSTSLLNKTLDELVDEINSQTDAPWFLGSLVKANTINEAGNQPATNLTSISRTRIFPSIVLKGDYLAEDPYDPDPYSKTAGGKWYYTQRKPGTPWCDKVKNTEGWSIDFDITVEDIEDSDRPSDVEEPEGAGLYMNDGTYYENMRFLTQEIILSSSNKSLLIDNTKANRYRITGQNDNIRIFVKRPGTIEYELLGESKMTASGTNQGNGGRPAVVSDDSGNLYVAWHDDGNKGKHQIYFAQFDIVTGWSTPRLLISDAFGASHPDIAVDKLGTVYVVYESHQSDYTDIGIIQRLNGEWSDPYLIATDIGNSFRPSIVTDRQNNVHVVWEDHRFTQPEIFYIRRNGINGQWESSGFGYIDTQISNSASGAYRPKIIVTGLSVQVGWTGFNKNGKSFIYLAQHQGSGNFVLKKSQLDAGETTSWQSSGQGSSDFLVSSIDSKRADFVDIISDTKGRLFVSWHDLVGTTYQIHARIVDPRLVVFQDVTVITRSVVDSKYCTISEDTVTGNIYLVFERGELAVVDPYDPYTLLDDQSLSSNKTRIMVARYNNALQKWESSNQSHATGGGFDVEIDEGDSRLSRRPSVSPYSPAGNVSILYETEIVAEAGVVLSQSELFTGIRSAVFDYTWSLIYDLTGGDEYADRDANVSGDEFRKEIRFGDFSNTIGVRYAISKIRYYLGGAFSPFNIRLVSPTTANLPNANVLETACNNRGDAWLGTDKGLIFYRNGDNNTFFFTRNDKGIDEFGIADREIRGISFDLNSNMYLATDDGTYVSIDHGFFWKLTGALLPSNVSSVETDSINRLFIGSNEGFAIINTDKVVSSLKTEKDNAQSTREIEVTDIKIFNTSNGMPSNEVHVIKIDANDVAWIGTSKGLIRFSNNQISSFTMANGLSSSKINDIAIKNTAVRFLATTAGVDKMTGVTIERLDFGNLSAPIIGEEEIKPESSPPVFNNVKAVEWKMDNVLLVATTHSLYQIEFVDDDFTTEKTEITKFTSGDFTTTLITPERNDDLQTFSIVGISDRHIPNNVLYEVILNGNKITHGFKFSPENQLLRFDYPLKASDIVQVNIRFDVEIISDFKQNNAEKKALGNKATKIKKLLSAGGGIYVQTGGDINTIQLNDETTDLPFDRITLDRVPPIGKIELGEQLDRTVFRVNINQVQEGNEYLPFDATSGVDNIIVSNFTNFTTDGYTDQEGIPFARTLTHDLGVVFDAVTKEYAFTEGKGSALMRWNRLDGTKRMVAGTGSPAQIFIYDPILDKWAFRTRLDEGNLEASVNFINQFQGKIVVGTGSDSGAGKIWESIDGKTFDLVGSLPVAHAYSAEVLDNKLYIGAGDPKGQLYSWDGSNFELIFDNISGSVLDLVTAEGELYAGTGSEGRIYRLDPKNRTQQILDVNADLNITSVGTATVNNKRFVFSGTGSTAQIRRSTLPDGAFTHSFKTISAPVNSMANVAGTLYATIGNTVYALKNVWNAIFTHTEEIKDISLGIGDVPWFISNGFIYKIGESNEIKNVYLKMTDRAGNETRLFTDHAG